MIGSFSMNVDGYIMGCTGWLFVHFMVRIRIYGGCLEQKELFERLKKIKLKYLLTGTRQMLGNI